MVERELLVRKSVEGGDVDCVALSVAVDDCGDASMGRARSMMAVSAMETIDAHAPPRFVSSIIAYGFSRYLDDRRRPG